MSAIQGSDAGCGQTPGTAILAVASAAGLYVSSTVLEPAPTPTASTSFLDKISFQTGVIPAGTYRIEWSYRWNQQQGSGSARTIARVQVDGVNIGDPQHQLCYGGLPAGHGRWRRANRERLGL